MVQRITKWLLKSNPFRSNRYEPRRNGVTYIMSKSTRKFQPTVWNFLTSTTTDRLDYQDLGKPQFEHNNIIDIITRSTQYSILYTYYCNSVYHDDIIYTILLNTDKPSRNQTPPEKLFSQVYCIPNTLYSYSKILW